VLPEEEDQRGRSVLSQQKRTVYYIYYIFKTFTTSASFLNIRSVITVKILEHLV
jgi:hypothetical protein